MLLRQLAVFLEAKTGGPTSMCAEHELLEVTDKVFGALCESGFKIAS